MQHKNITKLCYTNYLVKLKMNYGDLFAEKCLSNVFVKFGREYLPPKSCLSIGIFGILLGMVSSKNKEVPFWLKFTR